MCSFKQGPSIDLIDLQTARQMSDYHLAKQIKLPDTGPPSAGGQVKTSTQATLFADSVSAPGLSLQISTSADCLRLGSRNSQTLPSPSVIRNL